MNVIILISKLDWMGEVQANQIISYSNKISLMLWWLNHLHIQKGLYEWRGVPCRLIWEDNLMHLTKQQQQSKTGTIMLHFNSKAKRLIKRNLLSTILLKTNFKRNLGPLLVIWNKISIFRSTISDWAMSQVVI